VEMRQQAASVVIILKLYASNRCPLVVEFSQMFEGRRRKKLEKERQHVLDNISYERWQFEMMAQRARAAGEPPNSDILSTALTRFSEFAREARDAKSIDEFDNLIEKAEEQGTLRAYICPLKETVNEGCLAIDVMAEWSIPKTIIDGLRSTLGKELSNPDTARSALRAIFEENNSWADYTDDYEESMSKYTLWLVIATGILLIAIGVLFHFRLKWFPFAFLIVLLSAGAAGSCVSVMLRMPIFDVSFSGELEAYGRRIRSRVATGTVASLVGCAMLGWGVLPISLQGQTFSDVMAACSSQDVGACTITKTLIFLAVAVLFGFSERTLTSLEQKVLGGESESNK
jgi:hypothetical protein